MAVVSRHKSIETLRGYDRSAELFKDHRNGVIYGLPRIARKISVVTKRILLPYIRPLIVENQSSLALMESAHSNLIKSAASMSPRPRQVYRNVGVTFFAIT